MKLINLMNDLNLSNADYANNINDLWDALEAIAEGKIDCIDPRELEGRAYDLMDNETNIFTILDYKNFINVITDYNLLHYIK